MTSKSGSSTSSIADIDSSPVRERRGRGKSGGRGIVKGRGRGRWRGRGRGKAGRRRLSRDSIREGRNRAEEQKEMMRQRIAELSETDIRQLLVQTVNMYPSMLFDILEKGAMHGGYHPPPNGNTPSWCVCHHCREMPTQVEGVCCGEDPADCIAQLPNFDLLVLNEAGLAIARLYRQDMFSLPTEEDFNKANRHTAYRQFILWVHGRLGAGVRMTIPSCVWRIRDRYPDAFGQYKGFIRTHDS